MPEDPFYAAELIASRVLAITDGTPPSGSGRELHDFYIEAVGLFESFAEANDVKIKPITKLSGDSESNIDKIYYYFESAFDDLKKRNEPLRVSRKRDESKNYYRDHFNKTKPFVYSFSDSDLETIQNHLNVMRDLIASGDEIDDDHKQRLLQRLEKLQSELHKKVSDLGRFWDFVIEVTVIAKIAGENAKPLVDRAGEIVDIIWRIQSKVLGLPEGTSSPLLPANTDSEDE